LTLIVERVLGLKRRVAADGYPEAITKHGRGKLGDELDNYENQDNMVSYREGGQNKGYYSEMPRDEYTRQTGKQIQERDL